MGGFGVRGEVNSPILRADDQVRDTVAVEVDDRRAGRVSGQRAVGERSLVVEGDGSVLVLADVAQEVHVTAVDEQVEIAVAVPVGQAQLAATGTAGAVGVEPEQSGFG